MLSAHDCVVMMMFFYLLPILLHLFKNHYTYHTFNTHLIILIHINNMIYHSFSQLFQYPKVFSGVIHTFVLSRGNYILFSLSNKYFIFKTLNTYFILLSFKLYYVLYIIVSLNMYCIFKVFIHFKELEVFYTFMMLYIFKVFHICYVFVIFYIFNNILF